MSQITGPSPQEDTAARSLAHWSESKRAEMDAFYVLAGEDYRQLALAAPWVDLLRARAADDWRVLDVACGSGRFPRALVGFAGLADGDLPDLPVDLLDPSAFSVAEAAGHLAPPFVVGRRIISAIEDLPAGTTGYSIVWATHALYALPPEALSVGVARMVTALQPGGLGFIAHATKASHYLHFYDLYRAGVRDATPYIDADEVQDALLAAGATVRRQTIGYPATSADEAAVEGYLQRCAFDDTVTLAEMLKVPELGDYLRSCVADGVWTFDQEVALMWFSRP